MNIKGTWQVKDESQQMSWSFPDSGPASEQNLLELLRELGIPTAANRGIFITYMPTYEELQKRGLT